MKFFGIEIGNSGFENREPGVGVEFLPLVGFQLRKVSGFGIGEIVGRDVGGDAAGAQDAMDLGKSKSGIDRMFQNVAGEDEIEGFVIKGQFLDKTNLTIIFKRLCYGNRRGVKVDA